MPFRSAREVIPLLLCAICIVGCRSPYYADQGALMGGVGGAGIGAAVGEATGEPLAGAAIGGALGAITGGTIGAGMDEIAAENRAAIQHQLQQQRRAAVTLDEIIQMSAAGLSDDVIVSHVRAHGMPAAPTATDLIVLSREGVSDVVIRALQSPPTGSIAPPPPTYGHPPVIVSERYYEAVPPPCLPRHPVVGHGPRRLHWGVSFAN